MSSNELPVGFHFRPTDIELVNHYLKKKITENIKSDIEFIPEVDVYKYDPWDLPVQSSEMSYFFMPKDRKYSSRSESNQATMSGYWKTIGKNKAIRLTGPTSQHNIIGMIKTLVFHKGRPPYIEMTDWVMHEYRTVAPELESCYQGGFVLCKLFRKSEEKILDQAETEPINLFELNAEVIADITEPSILQNDPLTSPNCSLALREAHNKIDAMEPLEAIIYGREGDKRRIVELILSNNHKNHDPGLVCIVSDRGIGKTTMLHLIYHDKILCSSYGTRLFISMPEKCDEKTLLRMIIESLTCASCDATELETLEEIIKEELTGKKLLLLLDNFENKDQRFCNIPSVLLNVPLNGSAIVVSARLEVVSHIKDLVQNYYYLNHLSVCWCWMIFHHYTFGQYSNVDPNLVNIGKHLVSKCKNITCIMVLSGLLRRSITDDWWKTVSESSMWENSEMGVDLLPVLRVCYDFLPSHLKQCFKYCSLYPKDYLFQKHHLVLMWLSQGFIELREGMEPEEVGLEYFGELLSRSFFQHSPFHETKDVFLMPGPIHDFAQLVSINECLMSQGCLQNVPENACHLSLVPNEHQSISFKDLIGNTQNLQTIMVVTRSALRHESISYPTVNLIMDDQFIKFISLRTLDLSYTNIENIPKSIGLLNDLRYLGLSGTKIKCIPWQISKLFYLQTLEAKNCHYLEELPGNILKLVNLRHLDITNEPRCVIMPSGIGQLINLRTLTTYNVGNGRSQCRIEELENLNYLTGTLKIYGLENIKDGINAKEANLRSKAYLESLALHWSDMVTCEEGDEGVEIADELLKNLQPAHNIRELIIRNYPGVRFPMWIEFPEFTNLSSIILDNCYKCESFPNLGRLPMLRYLSIQKMYGVQRMDLFNGYPSLEILNIWEMYELEEWIQRKDEDFPEDFPHLRTLSIYKCPFLRSIPHFPSIIELAICNCIHLPIVSELSSLVSLKIEGFLRSTSIKLPKNLLGLKKLEISQCPELLTVEGLPESINVENVKLNGCPKLELSKTKYSSPLMEKNDLSVLAWDKEIHFSEQLSLDLNQSQSCHEVMPPGPPDDQKVVSTKSVLARDKEIHFSEQLSLDLNQSQSCHEVMPPGPPDDQKVVSTKSVLARDKEIHFSEHLSLDLNQSQSCDEVVPPGPSDGQKVVSTKRKGTGDYSLIISTLAQCSEKIKELQILLHEQNEHTTARLPGQLENIQNATRQAMETARSSEPFGLSSNSAETHGVLSVLSKRRKGTGDYNLIISTLTQCGEEIKELQILLHEQNAHSTLAKCVEKIKKLQILLHEQNEHTIVRLPGQLEDTQNATRHAMETARSSESFGLSSNSAETHRVLSVLSKRRRTNVTVSVQTYKLDDGYSWRKYGQKDLLGSKFPRSYFRCTHKFDRGCHAIKQVQPNDDDPTIYNVYYKGEHTCHDHAMTMTSPEGSSVGFGPRVSCASGNGSLTEVDDVSEVRSSNYFPKVPPGSQINDSFTSDEDFSE